MGLSTWSRDDMLEFAYSRGNRLRRRRVAVRAGAVACAVLAVALPMSLMGRGGDPSSNRVTVADTPTGKNDVAIDVQAGPADTSGGTFGASEGAGGSQPSSQAGPARASGLPKPGPGAGSSGSPMGSSSPPRSVGACAAGQVELVVATDRANYLLTEDVVVTVRAVNRSGGICLAPTSYTISFTHSVGGLVHRRSQALRAAASFWQPGEAIEHVFVWNQACAEAPCSGSGVAPRGVYNAEVEWQGPARYGPVGAAFALT